jgi:murein DD-endopeptidase MepM/ murein hydrolase activator NlpD
VVQPKDSLYSIARHFGVTTLAIQQANHLTNARFIKIGQQLTIPTPSAALTHPVPPVGSSAPPPVASPPVNVPIPPASPAPPKDEDSPSARRYVFLDKVKEIIDAPTIIPGRWKYIVLHHSATPQGSAHAFDVAHRERGMVNGLAYHFVIGNGSFTGDGEIEVGSRWLRQIKGGHLKFDSLNEIAIGICFVGNFDETRPSRKQIAAAIELISHLREICGPVPPILMTHTEIHPHHTDCPGTLFPSEAFHTLFPGDPDQAELARLRAIPNQ